MTIEEKLYALELERDQVIWDYRKGRYGVTKRDELLNGIQRDIKNIQLGSIN